MISLALTGLLFTAAAAQADYGYRDVAPQDKIDLCVAAIAEQANYEDANYVRHEVELIREYRTMCAVSKRPEPVSFRIRETR
jgi:UDP-N-acetylenolpyruvoylglucosamine reductase